MRVGERAVQLRDTGAAREVVALVDGDHKQRVRLVDPVRVEVGEERVEGGVVGGELLLGAALAWTLRRRDV